MVTTQGYKYLFKRTTVYDLKKLIVQFRIFTKKKKRL